MCVLGWGGGPGAVPAHVGPLPTEAAPRPPTRGFPHVRPAAPDVSLADPFKSLPRRAPPASPSCRRRVPIFLRVALRVRWGLRGPGKGSCAAAVAGAGGRVVGRFFPEAELEPGRWPLPPCPEATCGLGAGEMETVAAPSMGEKAREAPSRAGEPNREPHLAWGRGPGGCWSTGRGPGWGRG